MKVDPCGGGQEVTLPPPPHRELPAPADSDGAGVNVKFTGKRTDQSITKTFEMNV